MPYCNVVGIGVVMSVGEEVGRGILGGRDVWYGGYKAEGNMYCMPGSGRGWVGGVRRIRVLCGHGVMIYLMSVLYLLSLDHSEHHQHSAKYVFYKVCKGAMWPLRFVFSDVYPVSVVGQVSRGAR